MAVIAFNRLEQLVTDYVMGASGTVTPPATWKVALTTRLVSNYVKASVWNSADTGTQVAEIGATTAAGYARQDINRDQTASGWSAGTLSGGSYQTTGKSSTGVTFGPFTGSGPSPNGANSFTLTDGTTLNAGQLYFSGDTGATRTFAAGDTEKVTPSLKAQ